MGTSQRTNGEKRLVEININPSRLEKLIGTMFPMLCYPRAGVIEVKMGTELRDLTESEKRVLELIASKVRYDKDTDTVYIPPLED